MRIVVQTERQRIKALPDVWVAHFAHQPSWSAGFPGDRSKTHKQVYEELRALDLDTCTVADLAKIAPYLTSWIRARCAGCHNSQAGDAVVFEEEADYDVEGYTVVMCRECIVRGYDALPDVTVADKETR